MWKSARNALVSILLSLMAVMPTMAQDGEVTISKEAFALEVVGLLTSQYEDHIYKYDSEMDQVSAFTRSDGSDAGTLFLGNLYNQLKYSDQAERIMFLKDFYDESYGEDERSADDIKSSLLMRLRTPAEISNRKFYLDKDFVTETRGLGYFEVELVQDSAVAMATMNSEKLEPLGLTWDSAYDLALKNLAALPQQDWVEVENIYVTSLMDDYDCARLLIANDLPDDVAIEDVVVFAPSHTACLLTDKPTEQNLTTMIGFGEELTVDQRPLSYGLYVYRNGAWGKWTPKTSHPAYEVARVQNLYDVAGDYNDQQLALEQQIETTGQPEVFPASLMMFENDAGDVISLGVVTKDLDTWLPRADYYMFLEERGSDLWTSEQIPFDEAEPIFKKAGVTMVPGLRPVRYDVSGAARQRLETLSREAFEFERSED